MCQYSDSCAEIELNYLVPNFNGHLGRFFLCGSVGSRRGHRRDACGKRPPQAPYKTQVPRARPLRKYPSLGIPAPILRSLCDNRMKTLGSFFFFRTPVPRLRSLPRLRSMPRLRSLQIVLFGKIVSVPYVSSGVVRLTTFWQSVILLTPGNCCTYLYSCITTHSLRLYGDGSKNSRPFVSVNDRK